jgi:2-hydroxy-6-oxonona-2,4-dienedioate hydrolase
MLCRSTLTGRPATAVALARWALLAAVALAPGALRAATCDLADPPAPRFGREADVILCGDDLPAAITVDGLEAAGIRQVFLAPLGQCNWNDRRRGFHLVLETPATARSLQLVVRDVATGKAACDLVTPLAPPRERGDPAWVGTMPEDTVKIVDVKGIRTRYFERGAGPSLVLVHGGQSGGYNNHARKWESVFVALSKTFRTIALDRLGQGGTDHLPAEDYPNYYARDPVHLRNFIEALGLTDVTLVGHSQGGWPVMRVALDRPDLVTCLVNIGSVLVPDDGKVMREAVAFTSYVDGPVHPATGPTFYTARRGLYLRMSSGNNITNPNVERVLEQYQMKRIQASRQIRESIRLNPAHPSFIALRQQAYADIAAGRLKSPSLSIWGEHDLESPTALGLQFHQMLVDNGVADTLVLVPGSGHSPHVEFPEDFVRTVTDYCGPAAQHAGGTRAMKSAGMAE